MKKMIDFSKRIQGLNFRIVSLVPILTLLSVFPFISVNKEIITGKIELNTLRLRVVIPVLFIILAELLVFSGKIAVAIFIHLGILISLSLSSIFIKDPKVHKIYMPLMLLSLLRLLSFSVPIFFETTLYTFIFIYGPLAIPVIAIIMHQWRSLEEIGITTKNLLLYVILSIPFGLLVGLGEYMITQNGYLIPDLSFENLLKLTIIMVFFVGLLEELIFRSILQTRLEKALNIQSALIITSVLFGVMHAGYGSFYEILYTGFIGFVVGIIFYKTKSLPFVALLHGFSNVFLFGILPHLLIH